MNVTYNYKFVFFIQVIVFAICFFTAVLAAPFEHEHHLKKGVIPVLKHVENHDEHGQYTLEYLSGDGTNVKESGHLIEGTEGPVLIKKGSFKFTSPEGETFEVSYVADENGFRATGDHLPKEPTV